MGIAFLFGIGQWLLHFLYCYNCLQESWRLDSCDEMFLFWCCSLPYSFSWDTFVIPLLVLAVTTGLCWLSFWSRCVGCLVLVLHLLPFLSWALGWLSQCSQLQFFYRYYFVDIHLNWTSIFLREVYFFAILIGCMMVPSPFLDIIRIPMSAVSFLEFLDFGIFCFQNSFIWLMI